MERFHKRHYRGFAGLRHDVGLLMRERRNMRALRDAGAIDRAFQERLMLTVTEANGCRYCAYAHAKMALTAGLTREDIAALAAGDLSGAPQEQVPAAGG